MIVNVFIIRRGMREFLEVDNESDNWNWTENLDEATIYQTQDAAQTDLLHKRLGPEVWIYQIPYSITQTQLRKKKSIKKRPVKRSIKKK